MAESPVHHVLLLSQTPSLTSFTHLRILTVSATQPDPQAFFLIYFNEISIPMEGDFATYITVYDPCCITLLEITVLHT